jgi:hypothetical protein
VLGLRERWPRCGARKLRAKLPELYPELPAAMASTISPGAA